ncbi:MAG: nucleotide sugar dehydrogenase, partial [Candidatus Magasanikbacteria bacterium]
HNVLVYDLDEEKVEKLNSKDRDTIESCIHEQGLGDLLLQNRSRVKFSADYSDVEEFLDTCDAVFMCLPTPEIDETGESNLDFYFDAAEDLAEAMVDRNEGEQDKYITIVNKSTVPINMIEKTDEILEENGAENYGVAANPEFLSEGKAIRNALKPDRIVVGAWSEKDFEVLRDVYQRFYDSLDVKYIETNPKEAAAGKLLSNFYLFNKVAICFDVIGRTCEAFENLQFEQIRKIITSDKRISDWGFHDSLYAGGSCFIKDARSLSHQLQTQGEGANMVDETYYANKRQLETFISRAADEADFDWSGKQVALLGTAFKRGTNDIRNSPSIEIMRFLQENGADQVKIHDPAAMENFREKFPASEDVSYHQHEFDAVKGSDVVIISTDWPQFRGLADVMMAEMNGEDKPLIMDGRRMLQHRYDSLKQAGFDIIAVGSPFIEGN